MRRARPAPRPGALAGWLALLAAAIAVRALPWREVLEPQRVVFFGHDAWYHARRIAWGVLHFPERLAIDAYLSFPHGAKAIWSPGFDASAAALARLWLGELRGDDLLALERALVWLPPLLGAAAIAAAMALARQLFGRAEAWLGGALLCVLPAHSWYTRIGFVDHHAAVIGLSTGLAVLAVALARAGRSGALGRAGGLAAACGAWAALALWFWPGALLDLALVELGLVAALAWARGATGARRAAGLLAILNALAALAIAPAAWGETWPQWSEVSPLVLSRFQPLGLGAAAVAAAGCALLWRRAAFGGSGARRAASGAALGAGLVALAHLVAPGLAAEVVAGVGDALRWLLRDDAFQRLVGESEPLFSVEGRLSAEVAWRRFGPFVLVYPLALLALAASARRHPERWVLFTWSAGLFAATLLQRRFFATASVGYALVLAALLCRAWRAAGARSAPRPLRTAVARSAPRPLRTAVALAAAALVLPLLTPTAHPLANEWRAWRGEPLRAGPRFGASRAGLEVADWLRANTPPTHGWLARRARPEYGVLAPWTLGHLIQHRGRRPTVVDNFGDDLGAEGFAWARRVFASREAEIVDALRLRSVRYVVVAGGADWLSPRPGPASLQRALFFRDGSARAADGGEPAARPALVHHRLVYESRGADFTDPAAPAAYKVFEVVEGAEVAGRAAPGSEIEVTLALLTPRGRSLAYETRAVAGPDGTYRLRLPYATRGVPPSVSVAPHYALRCGEETAVLAVAEAAVRAGRRIEGPALCAADLTRSAAPADEAR